MADGMVSAASERWEEADALFQKSVQAYQEYALPWDEARVYYEWAIILMGERHDGPHANRAEDLLTKALSIWEPMGASRYAQQCRTRLG